MKKAGTAQLKTGGKKPEKKLLAGEERGGVQGWISVSRGGSQRAGVGVNEQGWISASRAGSR